MCVCVTMRFLRDCFYIVRCRACALVYFFSDVCLCKDERVVIQWSVKLNDDVSMVSLFKKFLSRRSAFMDIFFFFVFDYMADARKFLLETKA